MIAIRKGQLVETLTNDGCKIVAQIAEIKAMNEYFGESTIRQHLNRVNIDTFMDKTVFLVNAVPIAILNRNGTIDPPDIPVIPGNEVFSLSDYEVAKKIFKFSDGGINLGKMMHNSDINVNINQRELIPTHMAILAQTGGGKTYAVLVMLEEFLKKSLSVWDEVKAEDNELHFLIIDIHGEYGKICDSAKKINKIERVFEFDGPFTIPINDIPSGLPEFIQEVSFGITEPQMRILEDCWNNMRSSQSMISDNSWDNKTSESNRISLEGLENSIKRSSGAKQTKDILLQIIDKFIFYKLLGNEGTIDLIDAISKNTILILDFSDVTSYIQQVFLKYALKKVFDARTEGNIPPICIILEEAHNFAPNIGSQENSISSSIIKNIAREGRKFGVSLCVTSQRPSMIDTTLLSQCGTIIALRTVNDNDIKSISSIAEGIDVNILKRLPPGIALIAGRAVNYPVYTKIKNRIVQEEKDKNVLKNEKLLSIKGSGQAKFFGD